MKYMTLFAWLCLGGIQLAAQTAEEKIRSNREASNSALRSYDYDGVLSFLDEDALTTTGNGTVICGKKALRSYFSQNANKMYWVRTPDGITVNAKKGLAWETGTWKGYNPDQGDEPVVGGNYSAQWVRIYGLWRIRSQLFVTLE